MTYITRTGDTWDAIAHTQMGSSDYTGDLMKANMPYAMFFIFPAGIELEIPEVAEDTGADLPPWKTGGE